MHNLDACNCVIGAHPVKASGLGSITLNGDPSWDFAPYKYVGYNTSKAAVNMLTVQLAYELRETAIKVNAVNPAQIFRVHGQNGCLDDLF